MIISKEVQVSPQHSLQGSCALSGIIVFYSFAFTLQKYLFKKFC